MITRTTIVTLALVVLSAASLVAGENAADGVVNINSADADQLQLLPRVGPALAERIIEFRNSHGDFAAVDELVAVKGIGETSLEKLRPYLTVTGATTLKSKVRLPRKPAAGKGAAG